MRVDDFDFELPSERIALRPARPRDSARMLFVDGRSISDRGVLDLPGLLRPGDVLVFNDTRVIPAQLEGRRGEARIGATLHKREGPREWQAFLRNARRVRTGDVIEFDAGVRAAVAERSADGSALLHFHGDEPVEILLERADEVTAEQLLAFQKIIIVGEALGKLAERSTK